MKMTKQIMAKIDSYQDKEGKTKGKYIEVGIIQNSQHGEYALLHSHVDLSGLLIQQRLLDPQKAGKSVFCGIFENDNQQSSAPQSNNAGQQQPQNNGLNDDIPF